MKRRDVKTGQFSTEVATTNLRHHFFKTATPTAAWLAGLIAADGNITRDHKRLKLSQSGPAGLDLIEEVRRLTNHRLAISKHIPPHGNVSYGITLASASVVEDLANLYGVTPGKTLTYAWPSLDDALVSAFLRGYVDGDGCVSTYPTPQGNPMLHVSLVGTPAFIAGALAAVPAKGRHTVIKRCRALEEVRYNGRHAWDAANWLYADDKLYPSHKQQSFARYRDLVQREPPKWYRWAADRLKVINALTAGQTVQQAATSTGVPVDRIYVIRRSLS